MRILITVSSILTFFLLLFPVQVTAQYCQEATRFSEVDFFTEAQLDSSMNQLYATAPDGQGNPQDLAMDIYYPAFEQDSLLKRPFIMLIHGGGYQTGDRSQLIGLCRLFARRGYVTASMTHRFGPTQALSTLYRAQQDADAAMRFIAHHADSFRIDTSWLFMGGFSSGANICLDVVYNQEADWQAIDSSLITDFGGLNTSGNSLTTSFRIKGLFNNWGSALLPAFDTTEVIPMVAFHGELDPIINIDIDSSIFRGGSRTLHNFLTQTGTCSDLTVDPNGSHGVYNTPEGALFRTGRTACFFKSIICNTCASNVSTSPVEPTCSGTNTTSVEDFVKRLTVFPNPFTDRIQVEGFQGHETLTLLGPMGKVIYQGKQLGGFSTADLSPGIYYLRIRSIQDFYTIKLIKLE